MLAREKLLYGELEMNQTDIKINHYEIKCPICSKLLMQVNLTYDSKLKAQVMEQNNVRNNSIETRCPSCKRFVVIYWDRSL